MAKTAPVLPANNAVRLSSNNVILIVRTGYQTPQSMEAFREQTDKLIQKLRSKSKKVLILLDDSRVTAYDPSVKPKIAAFMREMDFDAVAVYGIPRYYRFLTDKIIAMHRQKDRVRTFANQHEAAGWLARQLPA